jgi:hypothetical protein
MHLSNVKKYSRKRYRTISNWTGTSVNLELFMFVHQSYIYQEFGIHILNLSSAEKISLKSYKLPSGDNMLNHESPLQMLLKKYT